MNQTRQVKGGPDIPTLRPAGTGGLRIGSLCTGYGGLDMAVMAVFGGKPVWCADNDKHVSSILAARYPGVPNLGDLTVLDWNQVPAVDIICAGFPCQDISSSGKRLGIEKGVRSGIWRNIVKGICLLRPKIVVVENVAAIRSRGLNRVLGDLAQNGYNSCWTSLRASEVGAAHRRERVFILGHIPEAKNLLLAAHTRGQRWPRWTASCQAKGWWAPGGPQRLGRLACTCSTRRAENPTLTEAIQQRGHHPPTDSPGQQWDQGLSEAEERQWQPIVAFGSAGTEQSGKSSVGAIAWGRYEAVIRRWERITGRHAPHPVELGTKGQPRLSPAFSEWLMGLPEGFVTGLGLPYSAKHRAIGNGVVPQQAVRALWELIDVAVEELGAARGSWADSAAAA